MKNSHQTLSVEQLQALYAIAYGSYETGEYEKAASCFIQLIFHNPFEIRYWKGLAAARQLENNYEAALRAWSIFSLLAPTNPLAHFHAAECLASIGEKEEALKALSCAERLPNAPKEKVYFLKERLSNV